MRKKTNCPFCADHLVEKFCEGAMRPYCEQCNEPIYENPVPATCLVVVEKSGDLLLVKRRVEPKKGFWCLPGGFMELGESPEQGALRELREETGTIVYSQLTVPIKNGFGSETLKILEQSGGGHACEMETSVSMYLGQRVLFERAEKWKPPERQSDFEKKYNKKVKTASNFDEITESGCLGDPTLSTREKGEKMIEAVVAEISGFIEDLKTISI